MESNKPVPTRPVMSGNCTINTHLSEMISEIVEPLALEYDGCEVQSSEEALAVIDQLNNEVNREGKPPSYNCLEKFESGSKLQKVARYQNSENERSNSAPKSVPQESACEQSLIKFPHVTGLMNQNAQNEDAIEDDAMLTGTVTGLTQRLGNSIKLSKGGENKAAGSEHERVLEGGENKSEGVLA